MHNVTDHRRSNFRRLVEQYGGPRQIAIALDLNESQVSQLISENIGKMMGHKLARKIEARAGLPVGTLDMATSFDGRTVMQVPVLVSEDVSDENFALTGVPPDTAQRQHVIWDNSNPYRPIGPLVAICLPSNALAGMAHEGDLGIFDCWPITRGTKSRIKIGSVVLLRLPDDGFEAMVLKQAPDGGYEFIATSKLYAPISPKNLDAVVCAGRSPLAYPASIKSLSFF